MPAYPRLPQLTAPAGQSVGYSGLRIPLPYLANLGGCTIRRIIINTDNLPFDPFEGRSKELDEWFDIVGFVEGWYDDSQLNRCCRRSLIQRDTHILTLENLFEIDNV